ncbi:conjugative transfer protein GumN [Undibacterium sp. KW1]|uniref:TraB/GumN family protein n=1 Tax=Undibacterium sp. KW1 TaxID=2058624 RepID=UPI001331E4A7|nr:TraB/GumN family protein [Undibacterium sp. KW1]BBB63985.1 conjugative transfer protein GumN [Undibacterium sp. KW1]
MKFKPTLTQLMLKCLTACGLAIAASSAFAQAETPAKGVFWEVKSDKNTAYLFGSIHLAKASFYPLPEAVDAAYKQADTLVVEVDTTDTKAAEKAMPFFTYAAPDKLENHIRKSTFESLQSMVGPAAAQFQSLKPTIVATALSIGVFRQQGYDASKGVDLHYVLRAKQDKKNIIELESTAFQASVLGGLSDEDADAMLAQTLEGLKSGDTLRETAGMIAAWKSGDAEGLAKILQEAASKDVGSKKLMKLLLDDRNQGMAKKILGLLEEGKKLFIVVGAGHLSGANSIIELLEKQGLEVKQIK